ncbi:Acyclic terpene utilization [Dillenia turbinata]|uniref:Acyclic terpene utilization n=1 Tax=Dillenia turbinata TaxID=194707 RepID=A0AAN8UUP4_9MAGN
MENQDGHELHNCVIKLRENPQRRRKKVHIGCGAGFGGDRPLAVPNLIQRVKQLNYLVLDCLAEHTLAERGSFRCRSLGLILQLLWLMRLDSQSQRAIFVLEVLRLTTGSFFSLLTYAGLPTLAGKSCIKEGGYELGWNWDELEQLAQRILAGLLLECGCQLTGGYFMHPDRDFSFSQLLNLSLPFAEVSFDGKVYVENADGSGGILDTSKCAEHLYEVGNPAAYITPDVSEYENGGCVMCLETEDIELALKKAVAVGAFSISEIMEGEGLCGGGVVAKVNDPYGFVWLMSSSTIKLCYAVEHEA